MIPARLNTVARALVLAVVLALVGTACQADVAVEIDVADDGSGVVTAEVVLDAAATEGLADLDLDATLPLSDLAQAGWEIEPPMPTDDGGTLVTAQKAFGTPSQLAEVLGDLTGDDGVFQDFALTRTQSFGRVDYLLTGTLEPSGGFDSFGDEELSTALGRSLSSIAVSPPYEASPEDIGFTVTATLPGEFQEEGSNGAIVEQELSVRGTWMTDLSGTRTDIALQSARRSTAAQVLRGVAVVAAVLAALVLFAQVLRVFSARRRQLQEERARQARRAQSARRLGQNAPVAPGPGAATTAGGPGDVGTEGDGGAEPAPTDGSEGYKVVALDGPGVLYREGDDIRQLLIPFARERGSTMSPEDIVDKARLLSLGRLTPADFWSVIGVEGDPNELDSAYLANHQLNPGVVRYLRTLRDAGLRVACITNDSAAWAMKLRSGHSLDGVVDPWVVSGSVGVRKPDAPLYEVLRRVTGEPTSAILVIDDDLDNLDAARDLGFGTRWFSRDGERDAARGHDLMRSFEQFNPVDTSDNAVEDPPTDG